MADVDVEKLRMLAESAERRAQEYHGKHEAAKQEALMAPTIKELGTWQMKAAGYLNDCPYWSGYKNAYRGILAMIELNEGIEKEMDAEPTCP